MGRISSAIIAARLIPWNLFTLGVMAELFITDAIKPCFFIEKRYTVFVLKNG
jgi:hypothetical protein